MPGTGGPRTVGVEEEFLLIAADGPDDGPGDGPGDGPDGADRGAGLVPAGDEVTAAARRRDPDGQFEHELTREQAEVGTRAVTDLGELAADLRRLRGVLGAAATGRGARLVASGTSPVPGRHHTTADDRYRRMADRFGPVARDQLTCGMHVHVGVADPEEAVGVVDRLRPWLPVLTALAANSPLLAGADTGYASFRPVLWDRWPTAGPTEPFGDHAGWTRASAALVASGAALDEGMLYLDARPSHRYPTVEIRVADVVPRVGDAVLVAALARALVDTVAADRRAGRPVAAVRTDVLRAARWRAAREGLTGRLLTVGTGGVDGIAVDGGGVDGVGAPAPAWEVVGRLVERVTPALDRAGDLAAVQDALGDLRRRGTGADLQREALRRGGPAAVVDALAAATAA